MQKYIFGSSSLMNYISPSCKSFQGLDSHLGILLSFLVAVFISGKGSECSGFLKCFGVICTDRSKSVPFLLKSVGKSWHFVDYWLLFEVFQLQRCASSSGKVVIRRIGGVKVIKREDRYGGGGLASEFLYIF